MNVRNNLLLASVALGALMTVPFDNGPGWKKKEDGSLELDANGNPIYIQADGREMTVQGDTIGRLNGEAKSHRERAEAAEAKAKAFDGLDPETARKAVETVGKIDAKKLIDAGEVDKVRDQIKSEFTAQLSEKDAALAKANGTISDMRIDGVFANSEFIRDRVAMPRDVIQAYMRNNFKDEDGKVVAFGRDGNRVMSAKNVGEYASPDEALEILIGQHPQKDIFLKPNDNGGSGNNGGGGGRGGGRVMKRAEYDQLDHTARAGAAAQMSKGELTIVD